MNNIKLSIIVPSIRTENWATIFNSVKNNIGNYPFEVIFIGPNINLSDELVQYKNIKCIRDFGCPSRSMQIGALFAEGKYLSWICDDGIFVDGAIGRIIERLENKNNPKFWYNWIYTEGDEYLTNRDPRENFPQAWYKAHFHANQKHLQGIDENWFMTLLFTINTDYYKFLGGINCEFEAINYNLHDLGYRAFRDGAQMAFTEETIFRLSWQQKGPNRTRESCPVLNATELNDEPLLYNMYGTKKELPLYIDFNNWRNADLVWKRKYGC